MKRVANNSLHRTTNSRGRCKQSVKLLYRTILMKKIARVFPRKTNASPDDDIDFSGSPPKELEPDPGPYRLPLPTLFGHQHLDNTAIF